MGRKIPVPKRHFGVRDPLKQLADKFEKIKDKIDNPPKQKDFQEESKSFKKFMALKAQSKGADEISQSKKNKNSLKKKVKEQVDGQGAAFKHFPNESDAQLLRRVNHITQSKIREAQYSAKYNVDIIRNDLTGDIQLKKRPKDEINELYQKKQIEAKGHRIPYGQRKKIKPRDPNAPKITRLDKLKIKKQIKKELRAEKESHKNIELKRDEFVFGEVVHAPPTLNVKPRHATLDETIPKPGKRNLLLKNMIENNDDLSIDEEKAERDHVKKIKKLKSNSKAKLDLKGKRKKLPAATRMILEKERLNTIELYRQSKKLKLTNKSKNKKPA